VSECFEELEAKQKNEQDKQLQKNLEQNMQLQIHKQIKQKHLELPKQLEQEKRVKKRQQQLKDFLQNIREQRACKDIDARVRKKLELREIRRQEKRREKRCAKEAEVSVAFAFFKECVVQRRLIIPTGGGKESSKWSGWEWETEKVRLLSEVEETAVDDYDMRKFFLMGQTLVQYWLATVTDYDDEHLVSNSFKEFYQASNSIIYSNRKFCVGRNTGGSFVARI
jgi:hypothetical protein